MAVTDMSTVRPASSSLSSWRAAWKFMDRLYALTGYVAALCMILIFGLTMFQVVGRYIGYNPAGLTNYVGYLTGGCTFLGLAHTLNKGAHVRVTLFLTLLGRFRPIAEFIGLAFSFIVGAWFSWYCWATVYDSYRFGDLSDGLDATPLWIPQISMALGATMLAIAVFDHLTRLVLTGDHGIVTADEPV